MEIGRRIQKYRKLAGLTQKELAEKLGVVTGTVQQYELGKRHPRLDQLTRIADALGVQVYELCSDKQEDREYISKLVDVLQLQNKVDREYIAQLYSEDMERQYEAGFDKCLDKLNMLHEEYPTRMHKMELRIGDEELDKFKKMLEISFKVGYLEGRNGVKPPNADTLIAAGLDKVSAEYMMRFAKYSIEEQKVMLAEMERVHMQKLKMEENE